MTLLSSCPCFVVYTDHQRLHSLLHQTMQTPNQHKLLAKLLGYEFDIVYKLRAQNKTVDALSRLHEVSLPAHGSLTVSKPQLVILEALCHYYWIETTMTSLF